MPHSDLLDSISCIALLHHDEVSVKVDDSVPLLGGVGVCYGDGRGLRVEPLIAGSLPPLTLGSAHN